MGLKMENEIVKIAQEFSREDLEVLKSNICKGASDAEIRIFIKTCQLTGLDPFTRQIYLVPRWDYKENKEIKTPQTSIDGYRSSASRTGLYEGQLGPLWCGTDGIWKDVWLEAGQPSASKVGILKKGFREPLWQVARFSSYVQLKKDGSVTPIWQKMGDIMLAKCAEALALRKAFPNELSSLYTSEEMPQASPEKEVVSEIQKSHQKMGFVESQIEVNNVDENSFNEMDDIKAKPELISEEDFKVLKELKKKAKMPVQDIYKYCYTQFKNGFLAITQDQFKMLCEDLKKQVF
jgi:phage recombination protein Bet